MATVFLPKPFKRKLADGRIETYEPKTWQCRFYVRGQGNERFSTGLKDKAAAQRLADIWEAQARGGRPYDPPTGRRKNHPTLEQVGLIRVNELIHSPFILRYIRMRRQLGTASETILNEVEQLLSSDSGRQESGVLS